MLAGKMKLTTFLSVLVVGAVCGTAGFAFAVFTMESDAPAAVEHEPAPTVALPPVEPAVAPGVDAPGVAGSGVQNSGAQDPGAEGPAAHTNARDVDVAVFAYVGQDLGSDKLKDVSRGKRFKLNVYQDAGKSTANRAKVDLDRDDKWDEKFTFADGTITREVAPKDDEVYTTKHRWDGKDWVDGG